MTRGAGFVFAPAVPGFLLDERQRRGQNGGVRCRVLPLGVLTKESPCHDQAIDLSLLDSSR
jgi:hypothetical protein